MKLTTTLLPAITSLLLSLTSPAISAEFSLHTFARQQLSETYFSEGANAGDVNHDGVVDLVYGPYWFAGPDFKAKHEIYQPVPQNRDGYADNFFCWVQDFNADGWNDVLVGGFPGTPAYVYENPKSVGLSSHWKKHRVFDSVCNESPQFTNIVGDERPELICTRDGYFGFATVNWESPFAAWEFHPISEKVSDEKFGHGLGVGDVNGDGRMDMLHAKGWYEQPASKADQTRWQPHQANFSNAYGGAEMYAYDVDGDGDNDIITSLAAHDFGLAWYEQLPGDEPTFKQHLIMGSKPSENRYGVVFSELHSLNLADMDGDGLKDIVTGKTYWSHHRGSPMWDAGAVVYWFKLVRTADGVDWIPYKLDDQAGIGRQVSIADVNADKLPDIVVGGMKGANVLVQNQKAVPQAEWLAAQPVVFKAAQPAANNNAKALRGPKSPIDPQTGQVPNALEAESLKFRVTAGQARSQPMEPFQADRWSDQTQLWWTGAKPGDTLTVDLPAFSGAVDLELSLSCAVDYGIVQLSLDDQPLGEPIDLFNAEVITTGMLSFPKLTVKGSEHKLNLRIVGANPQAQQAYMVGLDYVRVKQADGNYLPGTPSSRTGTDRAQKVVDAGVPAKAADGRVLNLDFETGTLADWTATGNAFKDQPIQGDTVSKRRNDMRSAHAGKFWIGSYEHQGDDGIGTLTSAPFVVSLPYASFLTNGGRHADTRVELVRKDSGEVVSKTVGTDNETMRQVVVDLKPHLGKEIMIRLVDTNQSGWGHLNFDHFRFHATRPAEVTPPTILLVADEYPYAGLTAQKAAAAMTVPKGFTVTVGACEPDVKQPIAMALDDRGRVWIAEAYEYPIRAQGDKGRDRILIFEDTDGDGTLDKRKVFTEGLNLVSGLEVGFGGVWVGAAPYLMFIPDQNADDVPDSEPQVLLDGWGLQDTHETLNAFIWGPDGWLYGCHGVFTHSRVGKPGTPDDKRIAINAGVWRYHPTKHQFEVFAHGTSNPWGVDFDDHGQAFITACVIPHLYHIIQGGRYQRQAGQHFNPYTYRDIVTIADHLHYLGSNPHGGNNKSDAAGGGHAHAGAMIYLGGQWPEAYRNQLFMNNIHGQRLNIDSVKPNGSGYVGSHAPDFLLTGDKASQILNLRYGPDGNAWMIDWYDMQACHSVDVKAHNRDNGRIYKIAYGDLDRQKSTVDLASKSDVELAAMVLNTNDWFVRHSRRLLQERASKRELSKAAIESLVKVATTHADDTRRLRAIWVLHVTNNLTDKRISQCLTDQSPYVRGWAIQLTMEVGVLSKLAGTNVASSENTPTLLEQFTELARSDNSPIVRLYLAAAAQRIPAEQRWPLLEALTTHATDAADHNLPLMYWYAAEPLADVDPTRALALAMSAGEAIPLLRDFMLQRIGSSNTAASLLVLVNGLGTAPDAKLRLTYLRAIRAALKGQRRVDAPATWAKLSSALLQSEDAGVRLQATALGVTFGDAAAIQQMRNQVTDPAVDTATRVIALQSLLDAKDASLVPTLLSLLKSESSLREAAIRGLGQYDDTSIAPALLAAYAEFLPDQKRMALGTLCGRAPSGIALLKAIEAKKIAGSDLSADLVRQLQFIHSDEIDSLVAKVWGTARESAADKLKLIADYKTLVTATSKTAPEPELGRAVFAKTCMKCHVLFGVGEKIGPDLTGSNRADLDYLLSNIVDPSSVMAKEYRPTSVLTNDGRVVTGLIKAEDAKSLTIQTPDALVVMPKNEIDERVESEKSMMPDDQLKQFSEHEVRSLVAYLQGKQQTPILASTSNAATLFNGRDLTGWSGRAGLWFVENGELVGRTDGLDRNEWIVSDLAASDFKLTLEVKLVDNAGNSGIQFRSKAQAGEVAGYQADIGVDWWGKLYEEHGRGLLWDKSGEEHLKAGDWNTYEVIAEDHHIRTLINGKPCVDLDDPKGATRGIIAFQLHSGGKTEVRFRNIRLEVLGE